jgi:phosphoglycerol transferase MdoB-like AlkP superfamily enzyme
VGYGGNYLSLLAIENMTEGRYVGLSGRYFYVFLMLLCLALFVVYQFFRTEIIRGNTWKRELIAFFLCIFPVVGIANFQIKASELKLQPFNTPLFMFFHNLILVKKIELCDKHNIFCQFASVTDYKFVKDKLFTKEFVLSPSCIGRNEKPNVIIFFVEGFSSSVLRYKSEKYGNLMPNLTLLSNNSLNFLNYYGHTAATYRGIKGQLNSGYSEIGGSMEGGWAVKDNANILKIIRNKSLIDILNNSGYNSKFYNSISLAHPFSVLIKSLGFQELATMDTLRGLIGSADKYNPSDINAFLSDTDFMSAISLDLPQLKKISPFIVGAYNTGTHAFLNSNPGEPRYGDGNNEVLNRFHNFDIQFGKFFNEFKKQGLDKNTILIVTADHATFPDKPFLEVFKGQSSGYFIDKIPLLIKMPCQLSGTIDAKGRNSLDLAPTIANLLNLPNEENAFMGDSLFVEKDGLTISNFAAYNYEYYLTTSNGLYTKSTLPPELAGQFDSFLGIVNDYFALERRNTLIKRSTKNINAAK